MPPEAHRPAPPSERPREPVGRVLRVKSGYNPNSSSIGTALPTYVVLTAASGALGVMLLHLTGAVAALLRRKGPPAPPPPVPPGPPEQDEHAPASSS